MNTDFLKDLSASQRDAVQDFEGSSLIVAGAGSGKTRVLTCRIAYMLERGVDPSQILALTFTNKAAKEMKRRIEELGSREDTRSLWMGTFHSVFARILRREASVLGYPQNFTIYDKTDTKNAIKACVRDLQLDEKSYQPSEIVHVISMAKSQLMLPQAYADNPEITRRNAALHRSLLPEIYELYMKKCKASGAMDFDDILLNTWLLFKNHPDIAAGYAEQFRYILIDEYQDTNRVQYEIIKLLALRHGNIAVVGDDSQSIYAFRGARIENILHFKRDFPKAKEYRLEQNYRSTQTVVKASNCLISKNTMRIPKECYSRADAGEKITVLSAGTEQEEAFMVVSSIIGRLFQDKAPYSDFAVLYRTNAQSRVLEEALRKKNIPYCIYGNISFYDRSEVKDLLAYLRLLVNPNDDEAFKRIINTPPRGIGPTTLQHLFRTALQNGLSLWQCVTTGDEASMGIKKASLSRLQAFTAMMQAVGERLPAADAFEILNQVSRDSGYMAWLNEDKSIEGESRMENVQELFNSVQDFASHPDRELETEVAPEDTDPRQSNPASVARYLANVSLLTQLEQVPADERNRVSLMTVHAAKGLEYKYVYIAGLEEQLFPSVLPGYSVQEMEEERRLFYVAMTRAKKTLTLSYARSRYRWGQRVYNSPSRFIKEIDREYFAAPPAAYRFSRFEDDGCRRPFIARKVEKPAPAVPPLRKFKQVSYVRGSASSGEPAPLSVATELAVGTVVQHDRFGKGRVLHLEGEMPQTKAVIAFETAGTKTLLLKFARLKIVSS